MSFHTPPLLLELHPVDADKSGTSVLYVNAAGITSIEDREGGGLIFLGDGASYQVRESAADIVGRIQAHATP